MASKRPREQQPGVVDEMANEIVHQVKAQRIVTTKGPVYQCGYVRIWSAVVGEQRMYAVHVDGGTKHQPCWGDVVHFSSAKAAAEAFVSTVEADAYHGLRAIFVRIKGTFVVAKMVHVESENDFAKAIEAVEQLLLTSGGVHAAVYKAE